MNYLRGAVNAISAPYQYYKELPPINPSTLTGAIDVIVIQRPGPAGDTELACSPFHVRFGKWQVLRPSDRKVDVSVNGQPIPYHMKIGEAGEAFFVFETDEDVPPDLITSPILQPTRPEEEASDAQLDAPDAHLGVPDHRPSDASVSEEVPKAFQVESKQEVHDEYQEPEFLDLNASSSGSQLPEQVEEFYDVNTTPAQRFYQPSFLRHSASQSSIQRHQSSKIFRGTDESAEDLKSNVEAPAVEYHHDVALDSKGYSTHARTSSEQTIHPPTPKFQFPSLKPSSRLPVPLREAQTAIHSTNSSDMESDPEDRPHPLSIRRRLRATSEPPPELDDHHMRPPTDAEFFLDDDSHSTNILMAKYPHELKIDSHTPSSPPGMQEYSWEWGAFPTPSPVKAIFGKGGRFGNWKSNVGEDKDMLDGAYVTITAKNEDDTALFLTINDKSLDFQLSLIPGPQLYLGESQREEGVIDLSQIPNADEFAQRFEEGKITYSRFLRDDNICSNPTLVIKWVNGYFVSLCDNPLLFEALVSWRMNTLSSRSKKGLVSENEEPTDTTRHSKSKSEPPTPEQKAAAEAEDLRDGARKKPGSLSWVQWWSRNRSHSTVDVMPVAPTERPVLRPSATEPPAGTAGAQSLMLDKTSLKRFSEQKMMKDLEAVPGFPSTPSDLTLNEEVAPQTIATFATEQQPQPVRKFVKTLRLTSDQLKALDLKPGANVITFSISSDVIACTSRIFVWDYMDHVVVSDIDGTITKSDGLGHVFAMIGRDWTHVGVAKLYTDIVKNGYKIMYLTSRAIGQADATRGYLKGIKQNDYQLPEGPVIMSPDRLIASLHREVIMRKPEVFKMACLRDIQRLFGEHSKNPFYAGFGNRITDALSYRSVNVPSARIFTIDSTGVVKMELLELTGYKSSYIHMTDLVDQMFPPINKKWAPEYTDLTYWKIPVAEYPLPGLTPPSPTLSAQSETSNRSTLAKIRNFRLIGGSRPNSISSPPNELVSGLNSSQDGTNTGLSNDPDGEAESRQMSSFERLVSGLRRSVSPSPTLSHTAESDSESDDDAPQGGRRLKRRSMTSMPGSIDGMHFGIDDEHSDENENESDKESEEEYEDEEGEIDEDLTMDEDLLAATEMKKIPFL